MKHTHLLAVLLLLLCLVLPAGAEGYGESSDPKEVMALLESSSLPASAEELYFSADTELLPESAVQYYTDETLACVAWKRPIGHTVYNYFEVCISDPSQFRRYLPGSIAFGGDRKNVEEMSRELQGENAVLVSSADFYGVRGISVVVNKGQVYRADSQLIFDLCMIDSSGDLHCLPGGYFSDGTQVEDYVKENDVNFCLEFGPTLYQNGRQLQLPTDYQLGQNWQEYTRAALCQIGPLHYLIVTANFQGYYYEAVTLQRFSDDLADTGCRTAYTIDGGQTASVALGGKLVNTVNYGGIRAISDAIYFVSGK